MMRRALIVALLVLLVVVIGLVVLARSSWVQARLRAAVLEAVSEQLAADLRLDGARIRLFPPSLELTGLAATSRARPELPPILEARRVRVSIDPVLLLAGRVDIDRVLLVDPQVTLVIEGKDVANLPQLAEQPASSGPGGAGGPGLRVVVRTVTVEGGRVRLEFPREGPLVIDVALERLSLRPDLSAPAADFELSVGQASLVRKRFRQPLDGAEAEGRVTAGGLEIRRFRGRLGGLVASARGEIAPFPKPELRLAGTVTGPLATVARVYIDPYAAKPFPLEGAARVTFTSSGPADKAEFAASVTASGVRVASVRADRVTLDAHVTYDRTTVRAGQIAAGGASVALTGSIDYRDPIPFGARLVTLGVPAGVLARAVGTPVPPEPFGGAVLSGQVDVEGVAAEPVVAPTRGAARADDGDHTWRVGGRVALRVAAPAASAAPAAGGPGAAAAAFRALLPAAVGGRFDIDAQAVRLREVTVTRDYDKAGAGEAAGVTPGAPLDAALAGQVGIDAPHVVALEGRIEVGDLAVLQPLLGGAARGWPLAGAAFVKGVVAGPAAAPTFAGELGTTGLVVGRYRVGEVAGPVVASPDRVSSKGLVWHPGATRATLAGQFDFGDAASRRAPRVALDVTADPLVAEEGLAAAGLDVPVQGRGRMAARLAGPLTALEGEATAELAGARLFGQPLDRVEAAVALGRGGSVRISRLTAARGEGRLTARGTRGADGTLAGTLSLDRLPIGAIQVLASRQLPIAGTVTAQATLAGTWEAPRLTGRVGLTGTAYEGVPLGDSGVDVTLTWPDLAVRGTVVQREVGIVANLRLAGARPFVVALDLNNPNLAPYLARIAEGRPIRASGGGLLRAAGTLDDLEGARAELRLDTLRLDIGGDFYFQNVGEVALVYERRLLSVVSATLQGPTSQAIFGGQVDLGARTLDLRVNGGLDLSLARLFTDRLARSRGTVRVVAQAVGPFASPRVFGAAQVEGGALTVRGVDPTVSVEDLAGLVVFDTTRIVLDNVNMRVGGGPARLTGAIELAAFAPSLYNLLLSFDQVGLAIPNWLPSTNRGDLRLSGRPGDLLLSGRVEVIRAVYNRKIDVNLEALYRAIRAALEPRRATRPEAAGAGPRVDVRITADNDVRIETGLFNGELRANLQLVGRLPEPNLLGSAEVVSGTINFRDTKFTVTNGRADFIDPFRINPSFDLTAEGKVREFQITMRLSGTVEKYRLEFSSASHPNLTELDILALLTVGVTTTEARGAVGRPAGAPGQISAAEALAILSGTSLRPIERQVQRFVGVDTFQIDPSVSRSTGAAEPKLTVGKHLNPDVTVTYSIGLGGRGEQAAQIEYRLSTNLALVAQWDEVHSFGGGVKFRFQFR